MKYYQIAAAVFSAIAWAPEALRPECVDTGVDVQKQPAAVVFDGTVTGVERSGNGYAATIEVHRVWKGDVPAKLTVYYRQSIDGPS